MHILALPPLCTLSHTPVGRRHEPGGGLVKIPQQSSSYTPGQSSYPSPPMSEKESPSGRPAQRTEQERQQYAPLSTGEPHRREVVPQPLGPRSTNSPPGLVQQRTLYPGESPTRAPVHYQPGRTLGDPSYGGMQITQNYAFGYPGGVPTFLGGQGPGPQTQPTPLPPPPPLRTSKPARRTKAHVASACVNCKKAHLSCDVQRPCGRCVASGKQDTCKDVQHKKRGRPRLRDDKDFGKIEEDRAAASQTFGQLPRSAPEVPESRADSIRQSVVPSSRLRADPLRSLRTSDRVPDSPKDLPSQPFPKPTSLGHSAAGSLGGAASFQYPVGPNSGYHVLPVAFMNLDLVVLKSNQPFQELVDFLGDVRGKNLSELLEMRQSDILQRLRNELRAERDEREPTYMPPITGLGEDPVQSVAERDVERVSQGSRDRPYLLEFRLASGQYQTLQTQIRLAKTSLYFVTLVVHTASRAASSSVLSSYLAPPTSLYASQTYPASVTTPARESVPQPPRPASSASTSAPSSPFFNFSAIRTSLPQGPTSSPAYGGSPSYGYTPTAGPEHGYFQAIQPVSQSITYPSPYTPISRSASVTSEPLRRAESLREINRPARLEGLQLPPIRTGPVPPPQRSPLGQEFSETPRERIRQREPSPTTIETTRPGTPDTGSKRRRLNIHEMLE